MSAWWRGISKGKTRGWDQRLSKCIPQGRQHTGTVHGHCDVWLSCTRPLDQLWGCHTCGDVSPCQHARSDVKRPCCSPHSHHLLLYLFELYSALHGARTHTHMYAYNTRAVFVLLAHTPHGWHVLALTTNTVPARTVPSTCPPPKVLTKTHLKSRLCAILRKGECTFNL